MDPSPKLRGRAFAAHMVAEQRRWIERCESSGKSYTGPNGPAIRKADEAELYRWEALLLSYGG